MRLEVREAIGAALGSSVESVIPVGGGDISEAYEARLTDGRAIFAKTRREAPRAMFACEARGLAWLDCVRAVRVPAVLAVSDPAAGGPHYLVLELVRAAPRSPDYETLLGRQLARLHASAAAGFGLDHDNFIATLPQLNAESATWADFYVTRRLEPQLRRAVDGGLAPRSWASTFNRLFTKMPDLVGPDEPPSRLHGDLWSGNLHTDDRGEPCLIDPAVYGGHREVDLAMLELFGGPSPRVCAAYAEEYPLAAGREERVALYQIYPLLVHLNLFGGGYRGAVERAVGAYA